MRGVPIEQQLRREARRVLEKSSKDHTGWREVNKGGESRTRWREREAGVLQTMRKLYLFWVQWETIRGCHLRHQKGPGEEGQGLAGKVDVSHQDEARMGWGWGVRRLCFGLTETSDGK